MGYGLRAAADDIVMMLPVLRSFLRGSKLLIVRKVGVRLPSIDARHSSSLVCSIGPGVVKLPPALATRMSTGPNSRSIRRRMASMSLNLVVSAVTSRARPHPCRAALPSLFAGEQGGNRGADAARAACHQGDF